MIKMFDRTIKTKNGKKYFLEWIIDSNGYAHISITQCGVTPTKFELLEIYDLVDINIVKTYKRIK